MQVDIINKILLLFIEDSSIPILYELESSRLLKMNAGPAKNYYEIENTGESLIHFENGKLALISTEIIFFQIESDIKSVCDNYSDIFILSFCEVFVISKANFQITSFKINLPIRVIGCNESEDQIFMVDFERIFLCQ